MAKKKLTSVRLDETLYQEFKELSVKYNFAFSKLSERSMYLYITDEDFRRKINNTVFVRFRKED